MKTTGHESPADREKSRYRPAIIISIVVHVVGAVVLLFWYLPNGSEQRSPPVAESATHDVSKGENAVRPAPQPAPAAEIPAEQIEASIDSQLRQIENLPNERKLSELEKNLKRLESVAEPASVNEVTTKIADSLGLDAETYQPKTSVAQGPFDPSTAQIQDVTRVKDDQGHWKYESVLVDAEGRTETVPMSVAEGETTYETFQQLKNFPMAEGIYRSVVMPMLQKMITTAETVEKAAATIEREKETAEP